MVISFVIIESPMKYLLFFIDLIVFMWAVLSSNIPANEKKRTKWSLIVGAVSALILGSLYFFNVILLKYRIK